MLPLVAALLLISCASTQGPILMLLSFNGPGGGTGFQVRTDDGHEFLVTNDHVCAAADPQGRLYAITEQGDLQVVSTLYRSPTSDLCMMTPIEGLESLKLAKELKLDSWVRAKGHPHLRRLTETLGKALKRETIDVGLGPILFQPCDQPKHRVIDGFFCIEHVNAVQSDTHIEPGSSGSPALNEDGDVMGVFFAGGRGYSYFIPVEDLRKDLTNASAN